MENSRRRALVDLVAAFGAVVLGAPILGRFGLGKKRPFAPAARARGGTSAGQPARVRPAPFTVKRHG